MKHHHRNIKFHCLRMKLLLFLFIIPLINGERIVQTNSGPITGISLEAKNVEAFLGIPYAEPPIGNLRFARPVPKSPWEETFNANQLPPACVQSMAEVLQKIFNYSTKMDEDCLHLNLWVPKTESPLKPIMIFIHGGGFMTGSSNMHLYDGATLSEHGDVIVASMNYRVGTLGFFSGFIDEAPGSMGMYDQVLAIQWIKDNAVHFGGDPDNIVLFGESAGAFSIGLHLISPLSRNLFRRAILQSGSGISLAYSNNNTVLTLSCQMISTYLGCATNNEELKEDPKKVVECMKNVPPEKIIEADTYLFQKLGMLIPRVGDEFIPMNPIDLLRKGEFKDTEVLFGITRDEGSMFTAFKIGLQNFDIFGETINAHTFNKTSAEEFIHSFTKSNHNYQKIAKKYFKKVEEEFRYTYLDAINDIMGDAIITCGTVFQADFHSLKRHPVYFYMFDYRSPSSPFAEWMGVPHFTEVPYVFGNTFLKPFSKYEEELSKDIMDMWIAFSKSGNPSNPGGLKWPKYSYEDPKYLSIGQRDRIGVKPDNYQCEAWRELYRSTIDCEVFQNFKKSMNDEL